MSRVSSAMHVCLDWQLVVDGQAVVVWHQVVDVHTSVELTLHIFRPTRFGSARPEAPGCVGGSLVRTVRSSTVIEIFDSTIGPASSRDTQCVVEDKPLLAGRFAAGSLMTTPLWFHACRSFRRR
jgi:hypothetical protein